MHAQKTPDRKINLFLWMGAAAFAVAILPIADVIHDFAFPVKWLLFAICMAVAIGCFSRAVYLGWEDEESAPSSLRKRKMIGLVGMTISGVVFLGFAAFYFWPSQVNTKNVPHLESKSGRPPDEKLPGFASGMMVQTDDVTEVRKKYQYSFRSPDGAKVGFYLSASNRYAFSVTDIHGEEYKLDIPLGANGLPFGKWAYIFCEVGTASSYSYLRALLNGREVARRDFDFPLELGSRQWMPVLGADISGQNSGAFMMAEIGMFATTLNDHDLMALAENALNAYGLKP